MAGKTHRLSRVASELNVAIPTLVDFLGGKGIKLDENPNTKLEEGSYELLRQQFAADQSLKEKAKLSSVKREKRETISLRDTKPQETKQDDEDDIDIQSLKEKAPAVPQVEKERSSESGGSSESRGNSCCEGRT